MPSRRQVPSVLYPDARQTRSLPRDAHMPKPYIPARNAAFISQGGNCHWCQHPMWLEDRKSFAALHGLTTKQTRRFQCTAEHLVAQRDGGKHGRENIVAACRHCNWTRHLPIIPDPAPEAYMTRVRASVSRHRWHPKWAPQIGTGF